MVQLLGADLGGIEWREDKEERCWASTFLIFDTLLVNASGFVFLIQAGCAEAFSFRCLPPYLPHRLHCSAALLISVLRPLWKSGFISPPNL